MDKEANHSTMTSSFMIRKLNRPFGSVIISTMALSPLEKVREKKEREGRKEKIENKQH